MAFCRYCGNEISDQASFCRKCGKEIVRNNTSKGTSQSIARMQPQKPVCDICGAPLGAQSRFCRNCGSPVRQTNAAAQNQRETAAGRKQSSRQQSAGPQYDYQQPAVEVKKKRFPWKRTIAAVLIIAIAFHYIPKWLDGGGNDPGGIMTLIRPGGGTVTETHVSSDSGAQSDIDTFDYENWYDTADYHLDPDWETKQIAYGTITEETPVLQAGSVSMTFEEDYCLEQAPAEIRQATKTVEYTENDVTVPLSLYEFSVEGVDDDTRVTLEIPVEKPAGGEVGCAYYDEEAQTLWPVSFDYDEGRGVAVIHATHLSTYCGFPVANEKTKDAMIAYLSDEELDAVFGKIKADGSLKNDLNCLVRTMEGFEDDWDLGMEIANDLGTANMIVGSMVSVGDAIGGLEKSMVFADGVGNTYIKNSIGSVGEIMNTNWGKAGSMPKWFRRYHPKAVELPLTDKLKSVYPYGEISRIGENISKVNISLSAFKIINAAVTGDTTGAVWESAQLAIDRVLDLLSNEMYGIQLPGLGVYMIGVGLFAYALSEFYSEALKGRKNVYVSAYQKYYSTKGADGGYRSGAEWRTVLEGIIKDTDATESAADRIQAEVVRYSNQFWTTFGSAAYLANVMTKDERIAWGAAAEGGLNDKIKEEISAGYRAELAPLIEAVMYNINVRNRAAEKENFKKTYEKLRRQMNRRITVHIYDTSVNDKQTSAYAGCIARFAGIDENTALDPKDKKLWETTLDKHGCGDISITLLAHAMYNAGDVIQVVSKTKTDEYYRPLVLEEKQFSLETPTPAKPFCGMKGQGPMEVTLEEYCGDWWKDTEKIGETVIRVWKEDEDTACIRLNGSSDSTDIYKDKNYTISADGVLTIKHKKIPDGKIELAFDDIRDKDHITVSMSGQTQRFVREDEEAAALKGFLGLWKCTYQGTTFAEVLAYRDGHILNGEFDEKRVNQSALILDSYSLSGDRRTLTVYDEGLRGGSITYQLTDDTHMTSVNGEGISLKYTLVESANFMQMQSSEYESNKAPATTGPLGYGTPVGGVTLGGSK